MAADLCTTLLSTIDSLQQLKSYISPQIRAQEMELRVHFMSKSTSLPMSFAINPLFSKTGNLSPYPITCCHLLIEPTTCELLPLAWSVTTHGSSLPAFSSLHPWIGFTFTNLSGEKFPLMTSQGSISFHHQPRLAWGVAFR